MACASPTDPIKPANCSRFTLDGDEAVEARLLRDQEIIADAITRELPTDVFRGLVLMGGYGRGEGGFSMVTGEPAPYNDYDYFVVTRGLDKAAQRARMPRMIELGKELEHKVGVEVDFYFLSEETLPQSEFSLMNAEMVWGHRVIAGDPHILSTMPSMPFSELAITEFTRLMLNRGTLLLMNAQALSGGNEPETPEAREKFVKYLFKATLATGDAVLAAEGRYQPSYPVKLERLEQSGWPRRDELLEQYRLAYEAKFHPDYRELIKRELKPWQDQVVSLWLSAFDTLESARLGRAQGSIEKDWPAYARPSVPKDQGRPGALGGLRNIAITARDYGASELLSHPRWSLRYPRERLISVLPLMLGNGGTPPEITAALSLNDETDWSAAASSFIEQWHRYA